MARAAFLVFRLLFAIPASVLRIEYTDPSRVGSRMSKRRLPPMPGPVKIAPVVASLRHAFAAEKIDLAQIMRNAAANGQQPEELLKLHHHLVERTAFLLVRKGAPPLDAAPLARKAITRLLCEAGNVPVPPDLLDPEEIS